MARRLASTPRTDAHHEDLRRDIARGSGLCGLNLRESGGGKAVAVGKSGNGVYHGISQKLTKMAFKVRK